MLNSHRRISKSLFANILKEGRNFNAPNLSLRVLKRSDGGKSAFSFVVAAKTASRASERNRLKRRGRHVVKKNLAAIAEGYYCVFFFKKGLLDLPFAVFEENLQNGLKQAGLLK